MELMVLHDCRQRGSSLRRNLSVAGCLNGLITVVVDLILVLVSGYRTGSQL